MEPPTIVSNSLTVWSGEGVHLIRHRQRCETTSGDVLSYSLWSYWLTDSAETWRGVYTFSTVALNTLAEGRGTQQGQSAKRTTNCMATWAKVTISTHCPSWNSANQQFKRCIQVIPKVETLLETASTRVWNSKSLLTQIHFTYIYFIIWTYSHIQYEHPTL